MLMKEDIGRLESNQTVCNSQIVNMFAMIEGIGVKVSDLTTTVQSLATSTERLTEAVGG